MIAPGHGRYQRMLYVLLALSLGWTALGFLLDTPRGIWEGMKTICFSESTLITDYMAIAGTGAAIVNSGLVCLISWGLLYATGDPANGFTLVVMGLMSGFSLFGKNVLNILPVILGAWLYTKFKKERFAKNVPIALLATALSPTVSFLAFSRPGVAWMKALAVAVGILIGFVMPPLSAYTFKILNGLNLYNAGFACGTLGMVLIPMLAAMGLQPETKLFWLTGHNLEYGAAVVIICVALILFGLFRGRRNALQSYIQLLHTSGRAPSDYLRAFGMSAVCINMGVNGLLGLAYVLAVGGDLNGPTIGGILTVMGFSAYGKHAGNITPVMLGILLGNIINHKSLTTPSMQIAGLFGTTLAPIAGIFGWPAGILAGLLHSSAVLQSGLTAAGTNLYNNGFSGGLVTIVLYPLLTTILRHRRPKLQDEDYYALFEHDEPIAPSQLDEDTPEMKKKKS